MLYTGTVDRIDRASMDYQAYYCEENVWRLLARPEFSEMASWAVLVSSPARKIVVLRQSAGRPVDGLIHWDYHAFAVVADPVQGKLALDLDSDLPFPCPLPRFLEDSFPEGVQRALAPKFRVIEGRDYVKGLCSDRSHMRRPDGSWIAPPPRWPAPGAPGRQPNLAEWISARRKAPGAVYDLKKMAAFAADRGA
jgi:hypothetical protein